MAENPSNSDLTLALLLSIAQAASALGISRSSFYKLIAQGEIRCVAIGRRQLVSKAELFDFIERRSTVPPSPPRRKVMAPGK
jgi:excisionase family DNA binding protein